MTASPKVPLDVRDVQLSFGGIRAIADLAFSVEPGEIFAVIGPNGAGKTSLFNVLTGVYRPQHGTARLNGIELIGKRPAEIRALGMARTFQNLGLFNGLSVLDNVLLGRHVRIAAECLPGCCGGAGRSPRSERPERIAGM